MRGNLVREQCRCAGERLRRGGFAARGEDQAALIEANRVVPPANLVDDDLGGAREGPVAHEFAIRRVLTASNSLQHRVGLVTFGARLPVVAVETERPRVPLAFNLGVIGTHPCLAHQTDARCTAFGGTRGSVAISQFGHHVKRFHWQGEPRIAEASSTPNRGW